MTEWKVYKFTREVKRLGSKFVLARSEEEAYDIGEAWIHDDYDMEDEDWDDDVVELSKEEAKELENDQLCRPDDAPDEWDELTLKGIFEWIEDQKKLKMVPGTDEYQEHWESLGQQRMFERGDDAKS